MVGYRAPVDLHTLDLFVVEQSMFATESLPSTLADIFVCALAASLSGTSAAGMGVTSWKRSRF